MSGIWTADNYCHDLLIQYRSVLIFSDVTRALKMYSTRSYFGFSFSICFTLINSKYISGNPSFRFWDTSRVEYLLVHLWCGYRSHIKFIFQMVPRQLLLLGISFSKIFMPLFIRHFFEKIYYYVKFDVFCGVALNH